MTPEPGGQHGSYLQRTLSLRSDLGPCASSLPPGCKERVPLRRTAQDAQLKVPKSVGGGREGDRARGREGLDGPWARVPPGRRRLGVGLGGRVRDGMGWDDGRNGEGEDEDEEDEEKDESDDECTGNQTNSNLALNISW